MDAELPSLRAIVKLGANTSPELNRLICYDVEFYPYTAPGVDPVFAFCAGARVVVARCVLEDKRAIEILAWFEDAESIVTETLDEHYNSLCWSQAENGDPLLLVTGGLSRQIRVYNIATRELVTTLTGHGQEIMDIEVSPVNPTVLATCSYDHSVRLWSLNPDHQKQPVGAICYGQGHKDRVITIAYHPKGQFILSGGMDTKVNLWAVPDDLDQYSGTDKPKRIHYSHFSTIEVHTDFVDCVQWYNDLILSHAVREDKIILWKIDNFNSDTTTIPSPPIPTSSAVRSDNAVTIAVNSTTNTHSAWGGRFQRLLAFDLPDTNSWYMRFSLFHELGYPPILVAGTEKSKAFFWDLQGLEDAGTGKDVAQGAPHLLPQLAREDSASSNGSSEATTGATKTKAKRKLAKPQEKSQGISNPFQSVKAHKVVTVPKYTHFAFRNFDWSPDGQWCVGVGDTGKIIVFHRGKQVAETG